MDNGCCRAKLTRAAAGLRMSGGSSSRRPAAVVFAPYLHTLGGGERIIVRSAELLAEECDVVIGAPRPVDHERWERLGFPAGLHRRVRLMSARQFSRATLGADIGVAVTNHLPLPSFARRSLLYVQFPTDVLDAHPHPRRDLKRWALDRYELLVYSSYVAHHVKDRWGRSDAQVIDMPVRQFGVRAVLKTRTILSVGRFSTTSNLKRQDVMLEAWRRLRPLLPDWRLVLAGGGSSASDHVRELQRLADEIGGAELVLDATSETLERLYGEASIYWHAAGFGRRADDPAAAEHFGMSTIEAMSAGAVPLVYPDGGQADILTDSVGGTWHSIDELVQSTLDLASSPEAVRRIGAAAATLAGRYAGGSFDEMVRGWPGARR